MGAASSPAKKVGFVVIYKGSGVIQILWNSRSVNQANFGDRAAPQEFRINIRAAVENATECKDGG
jgi:hypothetical protein